MIVNVSLASDSVEIPPRLDSDRLAVCETLILECDLKLWFFCQQEARVRGTYGVVLIEFQAASPSDASEVGRGQLDDVQFEGLLHEHDVVFSHPEAVEVAGKQGGAEWDGADLLDLLQRRLLVVFI